MDPVASILFGKTRQAVLTALIEAGDTGIYLRQLEQASGVSVGALHRELGQLSKADLVVKRQDGNRVIYALNPQHPITAPLREIIDKTCGLPAQVRDALQPLADQIHYAAIYGSIAKGTSHSASDVDLLLVADLTPQQVIEPIQALEHRLGRQVGFRIYSPAEFQQRSEHDAFLKKVLSQPLIAVMGGLETNHPELQAIRP